MAHLPPTKPRNAGLFRLSGKVHIFKKLKNLGEPRATKCPCFKGFGGSPIFCGGDDGNKHRKRKTHSAVACSSTKSAAKELPECKIALGHREDDHDDPTNYPKME